MTNFLTVKEAATRTGKSPSSVRRIIYPILEVDRHPDRHHIEPDVKTAKALRIKGENFAWKISEELLNRESPDGGARVKSDSKVGTDTQSAVLVEIFRKQLDIKDQQIAAQNDVIKGLSERLREGNILMGTLQRQLSPPDSATRETSAVVEADAPTPKPEKGSDASETEMKKTPWWLRKIF